MKTLTITQNTSAEKVNSILIDKLYRLTYENETTTPLVSDVELSGYIRSDYGKRGQILYLENKFPKLQIDVPESGLYIDFEDRAFELFLIATYYPTQSGLTIYNMAQIKDIVNNVMSNSEYASQIETIDFRYSDLTSFTDTLWNLPNLKNVYIKKVTRKVALNDTYNGHTVDKIIIGEVGGLNGSPNSGTRKINLLAIKNNTGVINGKWGDYMFRSVLIGKLYIGNKNVLPLALGFNDKIDSCEEIYVPTGCAEAYAAGTGWSTRSASLGYKEYDFDTDPDGIFDILNV